MGNTCSGGGWLVGSLFPSFFSPQGPNKRRIQNNKNDLSFDLISKTYRCYGVDLSGINGISKGTLTILMSEVGDRQSILENFRNAKTRKPSAPGWAYVLTTASRAAKCSKAKPGEWLIGSPKRYVWPPLAIGRANCALGDYCRRMKSRLGKAEGLTAVAHKLSRLICGLLQSQELYDEEKAFQTTAITKANRLKKLRKYAKNLGMQLTPIEEVKA